jgi:formylglycine-generating enzyme required for sulfatase activity
VPGGTFYRTYDLASGSPELAPDGGPTGLADPATVSGLRIDKYLVTVGRFRQYVDYLLGGGSPPGGGSGKHAHLNGGSGLAYSGNPGTFESGWAGATWTQHILAGNGDASTWDPTALNCPQYSDWTPAPSANENLPITCVNWYEAYAFCIWDGGFLPSEAEWGFAAAGGAQQREYAWGSTDPATAPNQYAIFACSYPGCVPSPVGTAASGVATWGQLDMAGETWEWMLDWMAPLGPCVDCADTFPTVSPPGAHRVRRGGSFIDPMNNVLAASYRGDVMQGATPEERFLNDGFRCARTP